MRREDKRENGMETAATILMSNEDCRAVIQDVLNKYELNENSLEVLYNWVYSCIKVSLESLEDPNQLTCCSRFNGCLVEYRKNPGIFNLLKPQLKNNAEGVFDPTGVVYDVTLSISTYMDLNFGIEDLRTLSRDIQLDDPDLCALSMDIAHEIEQWSENIEAVFQVAALEPKY